MTAGTLALIFHTIGVLFFLAGFVVLWLEKWGLI